MIYKEIFFSAYSMLMMWCFDDSRIRVDSKLKYTDKLELKSFKLSKTKTEYMMCQFIDDSSGDGDISLDGQIDL
jgi:hypothetical protein